tara:strand:+ start:1010 stop:3121 length:2112 start_codon:yes stop_codon:yes gene_type:complete
MSRSRKGSLHNSLLKKKHEKKTHARTARDDAHNKNKTLHVSDGEYTDSVSPQDGGYQSSIDDSQSFDDSDEYMSQDRSNSPDDGGYHSSFDDSQSPDDGGYQNSIDSDYDENTSFESPAPLHVTPMLSRRNLTDSTLESTSDLMNSLFEQNNLTDRTDIKSGVTGTIAHFKYSGLDPEIRKLCKPTNGYILIKIQATEKNNRGSEYTAMQKMEMEHANLTYQNEADLIPLLCASKTNTQPDMLVRTLRGIHNGEMKSITIIFNEPLYHNLKAHKKSMVDLKEKEKDQNKVIEKYTKKLKLEKDPEEKIRRQDKLNYAKNAIPRLKADIIKSSFQNLQQHMEMMGSNTIDSPATALTAIFSGIHTAQSNLHAKGYLHLDSQPRNFVPQLSNEQYSVLIIDFGASRACNENGIAISNTPFPLDPIYFYNHDALSSKPNGKVYSIQTDIFSLKISMIESLAYYCGANNSDIRRMHMHGLQDPTPTAKENGGDTEIDDLAILLANSDESRIANALQNLKKIAIDSEIISALYGTQDNRYQFTLEAIEKYSDYLLSPAPQGRNRNEIIKTNSDRFNHANSAPTPTNTSGGKIEIHDRLINLLTNIRTQRADMKFDSLIEIIGKNSDYFLSCGPKVKGELNYYIKQTASEARHLEFKSDQRGEHTSAAEKIDAFIDKPTDTAFNSLVQLALEVKLSKSEPSIQRQTNRP